VSSKRSEGLRRELHDGQVASGKGFFAALIRKGSLTTFREKSYLEEEARPFH